jgi:hypothetical protein
VKPKTHFDLAGALAEGFLGGAFAGAAGLRGAALPAGRLLRRDILLPLLPAIFLGHLSSAGCSIPSDVRR